MTTLPPIDPASLPPWMQRAMRGPDWGALLAVLFALVSTFPFFTQSGTAIGTDFERAAFRAMDRVESIREGTLYPRWTDETFGGYGAPIPQFTPPLPGLLAAAIDLTLIDDMAVSLTALHILLICAASLATYTWVTSRIDSAAGLTAAVLLCFTPCIGHQIPHLYGDPGLMLTVALIPALLWSVDRATAIGSDRPSLLVALCCAGLLLTDPLVAAIVVGLAIVITGFAPIAPRRPLRALGIALLCGTALAAVYWIPALLEASAIFWLASDIQPRVALTPASLFRLPGGLDPLALLVPRAPAFGLVPVVAAAVGLIGRAARRTPPPPFFAVLIVAGGGLLLTLLTTRETALLTPLAVILAGLSVLPLAGRSRWSAPMRRLVPIGLCALAIGTALPLWLSGRGGLLSNEQRTFASVDQVAFEQRGYGVPTVRIGGMIPATTSLTPARDPALVRSYLSGEPVKALVTSGSAQIGTLEAFAHALRIQFSTFAPTTVALLYADFPGWQAAIGGETVPFAVSGDQAGLSVMLPENFQGELTLRLDTTPARTLGWLASAIGATGCMAMLLRRRTADDDLSPDRLTPAEGRLFVVLLVGLISVAALNASSPEWASLAGWTPQPGVGLTTARPLDIRSDVGLELIGSDPYTTRIAPGQQLDVTLYWQALRPIEQNYRVQLGLRDQTTGQIDTLSAIRHPGDLPLPRWQARRYVHDSWSLVVPPSLTTGVYDIVVSAFLCDVSCNTRQSITFFDASGALLGTVITLPSSINIATS